jgi:hypothetical protein
MAGLASNGGRYQVHCSPVIARKLKEIQKQATEEGRGQQVLAAIRRVWHRLSEDPTEFGEALYRLPALRLRVRHGASGPLLLYFGIHETKPLVFIKSVVLLPEGVP